MPIPTQLASQRLSYVRHDINTTVHPPGEPVHLTPGSTGSRVHLLSLSSPAEKRRERETKDGLMAITAQLVGGTTCNLADKNS